MANLIQMGGRIAGRALRSLIAICHTHVFKFPIPNPPVKIIFRGARDNGSLSGSDSFSSLSQTYSYFIQRSQFIERGWLSRNGEFGLVDIALPRR